jgi:hypothetical protein
LWGTRCHPKNVIADVMSEELDELASSYVDGEASPEERARVEADTNLLDLVEEFRALRLASLPRVEPSAALRNLHISAALAQFDSDRAGQSSGTAAMPSQDVSLPASLANDDGGVANPDDSGSTSVSTTSTSEIADNVVSFEKATRRRAPRWLANAAATAVLVGGVGFALAQLSTNDSNDSVDIASNSVSAEADEAAEDETEASALRADDAIADDAGAVDEDMANDTDAAEASSAVGVAEADDSEEATADESIGDGGDEPLPIEFDLEVSENLEASEILIVAGGTSPLDLALRPLDAVPNCSALVGPFPGGEPNGYLSVLRGETPTQLFVFGTNGEAIALLVDQSTCLILSDE